jgi:hypothetical protein
MTSIQSDIALHDIHSNSGNPIQVPTGGSQGNSSCSRSHYHTAFETASASPRNSFKPLWDLACIDVVHSRERHSVPKRMWHALMLCTAESGIVCLPASARVCLCCSAAAHFIMTLVVCFINCGESATGLLRGRHTTCAAFCFGHTLPPLRS